MGKRIAIQHTATAAIKYLDEFTNLPPNYKRRPDLDTETDEDESIIPDGTQTEIEIEAAQYFRNNPKAEIEKTFIVAAQYGYELAKRK